MDPARFRALAHHQVRWLLIAGLSAALAACGGGAEDPAPAPPPPTATEVAAGQRVQQDVGAAGGSVSLSTREGAVFTLSVPAGAVPDHTRLGLETANASQRQRFHLRLSPAGLVPAQPLTLTVALPPSLSLPAGAVLSYDSVPMPYTPLPDGRLELRLRALAGAATTAAGANRAQALSARPLARTLADAPATLCGSAPVPDFASGGLTASDAVEADLYGQCMLGAVHALAAEAQYTQAVRLATSLAAYLQKLGAANTVALSDRYTTEARAVACTAYAAALDTAAGTTVTRFATLTQAVKPVLFWEHAVQQLGASCPGVPPTRYTTVIENLTSDALRFFASQQGAVVDVGSVEYTEAVQETRDGSRAVTEVQSLDAPAPVQALARAQLQQRAQPAVLDAVLQAPWQRCRDSGNFDKLIELMELMGQPASVKTAAQYCATQLQAQAANSAGTTTATLDPELGGVAAGNQRTSGSLAVAKDGKFKLSGPIRQLQCPVGSTGGTESLQVRLGSTVLQTITTAPYLASTLEIDIAPALEAAGINAATFTTATLSLVRTGSPCGGFWGSHPEPLLSVTLTSGGCSPAAGYSFCITPLVRSDGSAVDAGPYPWAAAINDKAEVLFKQLAFDADAVGVRVWAKGAVRDLPAGFGVANATPRLNNAGVVVGIHRADGTRNDGEDAGVALPDGSVVKLPLPDYPVGMNTYSREVRFDEGPPVVADNGSVYGTALLHGTVDSVSPPTGCEPAQFCYHGYVLRWDPPYTSYSVIEGPIYISAPQIVRDVDAAGVVVGSRITPAGQRNVPYQWNPAAAVDRDDTRGQALLRDDQGATWWIREDEATLAQGLRVTRQPPHLSTGDLADVRGIGKAGFVQLCGSSTSHQLQLRHVYDGRTWSMTGSTLVDPALGWDFGDLMQSCESWGFRANEINRHGHLLVHGTWRGVFTPAILTPRGQPLP